MFGAILEECRASEGKLDMQLWAPMRLVVEGWSGDTQEIEGIHNLILVASRASSTITLETLDARVGLRKDVGLGSRSTWAFTGVSPTIIL